MYQISEGQVIRNEYSTIPYTWIHSEQSNKSVCIMLPGLGYTTQRPLFHYATGVCLDQNVDVLHINYQFTNNEPFKQVTETERNQWLFDDVKAVMADVLQGIQYEQCFMLSKSIGTIPMAMEWSKNSDIHQVLGIWLTPLLSEDSVYQALLHTDKLSLCVIGDQDHHYIEERVTSLKNNPMIRTVVLPHANHGLEIAGDILGTLDAVKIVMESVQKFVGEHKR